MTAALLGRLDRAAALSEGALALARELGHPGSLAHAHWFACETHFLRREPAAVRDLASNLQRIARENGSAVSVANAKMFLGWSLTAEQNVDDGAARLREGLED